VKFDLQKLMLPIDNIDKWRAVQKKYWRKYGRDTHVTTTAIVGEIGEDEVNQVLEQEHAGYLSGETSRLLSQDWPAQILAYCDVRVVPTGVVPLKERIADLHTRYGRELEWYDFLYKLEQQVREMTTTNLEEVTEEKVEPFFEKLLEYEL
jgi:hypothetical protein